MTARALRQRIDRARDKHANLTAWIAELESVRERLLIDRPDPRETGIAASKARTALHQVEHGATTEDDVYVTDPETAAALRSGALGLFPGREELERLAAEITALESQLPSGAEVAAAERETEELAARAVAAGEETAESWADVVAGIATMVTAVERFASARQRQRLALGQRNDLAERTGVDVPGVRAFEPEPAAVRAAHDVLARARQAVVGGDAADLRYALAALTGERVERPTVPPPPAPDVRVHVDDEASDGVPVVADSGGSRWRAEAAA